jgi:hypothetical protein
MDELLKTITFRFGDCCSIEDFAGTMSRIQSSPSVEVVTSVKREEDLTERTAMFTAFLFDETDEAAVKKQITAMPGIVWVTNGPNK